MSGICQPLTQWRAVILAAWCALATPLASAAITQSLSFGVLPYKTPQRILSDVAPLADYLGQSVGRPLLVQTAKDYAEFLRRTRQGNYDILLTAPHFAALAAADLSYQPIAMTGYRVQALLLVANGSPIRSIAQLQGRVIAMPQREALIYQLGVEMLRAHGLEPGRNVTLREYPNNQLALAAPLRADTDASIGGALVLRTSSMQNDLRVVAESKAMPGLILMVHSRVSPLLVQNLRNAVLEFYKTPEGATYLQTSGHLGWLPMAPDALRPVENYARRVAR